MSIFKDLSGKLSDLFKNIVGHNLSEKEVKEFITKLRPILLQADVALEVVDNILQETERALIGKKVQSSFEAEHLFKKTIYEILVKAMGESQQKIELNAQPPVVILMAGLQGSGKTTTTAKIGFWLKQEMQKKVLTVSTDVYRPAAREQLAISSEQAGIDNYLSSSNDPIKIVEEAIQHAKVKAYDILLVDTAGRLHIDQEMMGEIQRIHKKVNPKETLFIVDSMIGQDAVNTAKAFNEALPITGIVLTKTDGDSRGGAALSVVSVVNKPIKFMGSGEKISDLKPFDPQRVASLILDMGDILSFIEEAEKKIEKDKAEKLAKKIQRGENITLDDFLTQLQQINKMGGITNILKMMPGTGSLLNNIPEGMDIEKTIKLNETIINSMTKKERKFPDLINNSPSRKKRIADGSGTSIKEVSDLIKSFSSMQKTFKKFSSPSFMGMMSKLGNFKNMMDAMKDK